MEINPNLKAGRVEPAPASRPAARPVKESSDQANFSGAAALEQALQNVPNVRTEAVERAKELVGDPTYPPRETIQKIADLLAMHLSKD